MLKSRALLRAVRGERSAQREVESKRTSIAGVT